MSYSAANVSYDDLLLNKIEVVQDFLLGNSWIANDVDFFQALAEFLSRELEADYVCIDKLVSNMVAETLAVYHEGNVLENISYTLLDTPCGEVVSNNVCCIPDNVSDLFPNDILLSEIKAKGYLGITLMSPLGVPIGLIAVISTAPLTDIRASKIILKQVATRAALELEHRIRQQKFISLHKSNLAMLSSTDEVEMLKNVCEIITTDFGYSLMWIGMANNDDEKSVTPVASAGFEQEYIESIDISWDENKENGRGPTGKAIRTGKVSICQNMFTEDYYIPWREKALKYGFSSSIAIPIKTGVYTLGAMMVYAKEPNFFTLDKVNYLEELSNDLAIGITNLRLRKEIELALKKLNDIKKYLKIKVRKRTGELRRVNEHLMREIEIRRNNESLLRLAEEKYRTVANFTYNCESWLSPDGEFIYLSPSFETTTGYKVEEFMEDPSLYYRIAHPDDREIIENHFNQKLDPHFEPCHLSYRIITRDGEIKWMDHTCHPVFNSAGKWLGRRGSNVNITRQKEAESILIESQNQLRALTRRLDDIAAQESKRIAREIHDELGHLLTALKFDIDNLSEYPNKTIKSLHKEIASITKLSESLITTVRKISTQLRPEILDHFGLIPAIEWQVNQFSKRTKICSDIKIQPLQYQFDSKQTTVIFLILQEILTNVARHSKATHIAVSINKIDSFFSLEVVDNGKGFDFDNTVNINNLGLLGMRERAISIGGEIIIKSRKDEGTSVIFNLKIDND